MRWDRAARSVIALGPYGTGKTMLSARKWPPAIEGLSTRFNIQPRFCKS